MGCLQTPELYRIFVTVVPLCRRSSG